MEGRERLGSRLGFIMLSAGCAIGCGNVWKFPWMCGQYGGGSFMLVYILCLIILGMPVLLMEFAVGRASVRSAAMSFDVLEPKGTKWHWHKYTAIGGNMILMMFYTTVAGWMLYYLYKTATGAFEGLDAAGIVLPTARGLDVYCAALGEKARKAAFSWVIALRGEGISAEMDHMGKSFKAQMKAADRANAAFVVICGDDELAKNEIIIKNMTDSAQNTVERENVIKELIRRIQK